LLVLAALLISAQRPARGVEADAVWLGPASSDDPSHPISSELRQLLSAGDAAPGLRPLKSRYPIWAMRARDARELFECLGPAMLWVDLTGTVRTPLSPADDLNGDGRIDQKDIELGVRRALKGPPSVPGAEYDVARLIEAFNRYGQKVPGKTVEMPGPTKRLLARLEALGLAEKTAEGWRPLKPASLIFYDADCDESCLAHELNHALYFSEPAFRARVARIWKELPARSQDALRAALSSTYALKEEDLLLTEFAAYGIQGFPSPPFRFKGPLADSMRELSRRIRSAQDEFLPPRSQRRPARSAPARPADGSRIMVLP
jgi:hypothetical protein